MTPLLSAVQRMGVREVSIGSLKVRTSGVCTVPRAWLEAGEAETRVGGIRSPPPPDPVVLIGEGC